ncbi:MAG: hypothetical protein F3742_11980 [Nitrospinae bacterium]|nr:hypothetical protein [Nitrospinota bacterium]
MEKKLIEELQEKLRGAWGPVKEAGAFKAGGLSKFSKVSLVPKQGTLVQTLTTCSAKGIGRRMEFFYKVGPVF